MPDNSPAKAHFDHVGPTGELIFTTGTRSFSVPVDETLNKAMLEARQVAAESRKTSAAATARVPISQIQSLIRAGANPTKVAEHYGLSEALVRRFSSAVETEKQYAIEQFLSVAAPKDSRAHSLGEIIERSLDAVGTGMEGVSWRATRRGLEPWRITARFTVSSRSMKAEWSWNMHDNSVACINENARRLLGLHTPDDEHPSSQDDLDRPLPTPFPVSSSHSTRGHHDDIPGSSIRSARIERAVSSWAQPESPSRETPARKSAPSVQPTRRPTSLEPVAAITGASSETRPSLSESLASVADVDAESESSDAATPASSQRTSQSTPRQVSRNGSDSPASAEGRGKTQQQGKAQQDESTAPASTTAPEQAKGNRRRSGRSAVPSWDEILFGD